LPIALLSVSDKTGLTAFARGLRRLSYELYATSSTLDAIQEAAVDAHPVSDLTGFPEMMDGRVKTLHPGVHAGILARRDKPEHMEALAAHGLREIDLVCCNLYPFVETVTRPDVTFEEAVEQIDIGGPAMIRAAAKNHESVVVVVRPERYSEVLGALNEDALDEAMRRRLAAEAYAHTSAYDAWIAAYMREGLGNGFPAELSFAGLLTQPLKYGENEHQRAAFYRFGPDPGGLGGATQVQGGPIGFNNIQDASAAYQLVLDYDRPAWPSPKTSRRLIAWPTNATRCRRSAASWRSTVRWIARPPSRSCRSSRTLSSRPRCSMRPRTSLRGART
jgi:phosphoribosylaminoimidazolecarboxamide formyltransferase/IMP cyclohydrolase